MSEEERDYQVADYEFEQGRCPQCGSDPAVCGDAEREWFPQRTVCYVEMNIKAAVTRYAQLHQDKPYHDGTFTSWSEKPTLEHPYHFGDGVRIAVSAVDLTPDDDFLGRPKSIEDLFSPEGGDPWPIESSPMTSAGTSPT